MKLSQLLMSIDWIQPLSPLPSDTDVTAITSDSRQVGAGTIFVALPGSHADGHDYIEKALAAGAVAVVVQQNHQTNVTPWVAQYTNVAWLMAANTWTAIGALANEFYDRPSTDMMLVGVTGTNGKTTVTHLIEQMLLDKRQQVGLIGTLGIRKPGSTQAVIEQSYQSTGHTTPMAMELQEIIAELKAAGTTSLVMEVSSHALEQNRVYGCDFKVAVHTNLTQDHLDFHQTMEDYCQAKCKLFQQLNADHHPVAVINADDAWAHRFLAACPQGVKQLTYGLQSPDVDIKAENVTYAINGARFTVVYGTETQPANLKIAGKFGVYNALAAIGAGLGLGLSLQECIQSLEKVAGVRGRFEVVAQNPSVIVDYAHTPDGLENVLSAARLVTPTGARLIAVFGCGGDRDATKRPKMGHIAERLADVLLVTSDNPRTEDPQQILTDVLSGIERFDASRMLVNVDRRQAIQQAIDLAAPDDVIVVAGKGHEDYQILGTQTIHFDDREEVQTYIAAKNKTSPAVSAT